VQHSDVIVHIAPGRVQVPSPPRQRRTPVVAGSHPVSPPPFGQQFEVAPAPPQTSPAGMQDFRFPHRMIGRPSMVVPRSSQPPEQHSPSAVHGSSWTRQPPSGWHTAVPVPAESRHAVVQHDPLKPSDPQGWPATPQAPEAAHAPTATPIGRSHMPMQHCASSVQSSPAGRHAADDAQRQSPPPAHGIPAGSAQRSVQQEAASVHDSPSGLHVATGLSAHTPPVQVTEQQSSAAPHASPIDAHALPPVHIPPSQLSEQQSPGVPQVMPAPRHPPSMPGPPSAPVPPSSPQSQPPTTNAITKNDMKTTRMVPPREQLIPNVYDPPAGGV
jgi:hypothetical protein